MIHIPRAVTYSYLLGLAPGIRAAVLDIRHEPERMCYYTWRAILDRTAEEWSAKR